MTDERDYSKDIVINENELEKEWILQPSLYLHYANEFAEMSHQKDLKKAVLEYTYSVLYDDAKTNWKDYFETKPTEPATKEWIIRHKKYQTAEKELNIATKNANIMLNVKNAFEHRKAALSNIVSLMITGFHSEPKNKTRDIVNMRVVQKKALKKGLRAKPESRKTKK